MLTQLSALCLLAPLSGATPLASTEPVRQDALTTLLGALPESAHSLVYSEDFAAFRARAERNSWAQLFGSPHGHLLLTDLGELGRGGSPSSHKLGELAASVTGESLIFASDLGGAFMTRPPSSHDALLNALKGIAPELAQNGRVVELSIGNLTFPSEPNAFGPLFALLDHPDVIALLSAPSEAELMELTRQCITGLGSDEETSFVQEFKQARKSGGSNGGLEFYVDFSAHADRARAELRDAAKQYMTDPVALLGLDEGVALYLTLNLHAGVQVECRGHISIPKDSGLAQLADTFTALAPTLPGMIPAETWAFHALQWDIVSMSQKARAMLNEETQKSIDMAVAGGQMLGADPEDELFNQLTGSFTLHDSGFSPAESDAGEGKFSGEERFFMGLGLSIGLRDADVFQSALEDMIGGANADQFFDLQEIDGYDAFLMTKADPMDGGFAFVGNQLAISLSRQGLQRQITVLAGQSEKSLLRGTPMAGIIDENQGACYLSCLELEALAAQVLAMGKLDAEKIEGLRESMQFTAGAHLVGSVRRVENGFDLRLQTR